jgi:hypothetical protein
MFYWEVSYHSECRQENFSQFGCEIIFGDRIKVSNMTEFSLASNPSFLILRMTFSSPTKNAFPGELSAPKG